ncbi:MAG TPA: serine hydrolase domain-containing protein [Anaeromyxobacter sp.]|nr:serine hydrolase domain-containing protein [Anaeromyxobacter sp.]
MSRAERDTRLDGYVDPRFVSVREAFKEGFAQGKELFAAVAVYHRGALVVDLAAGARDPLSQDPYDRGTLQPVLSATKGITALAANMLADRGRLDLDRPVASYWPEFAREGKSGTSVRWLLTHESGVLGLDRAVSQEQLLDWAPGVEQVAEQAPDWRPGTQHGYHALTFGFLVGELIRRVAGMTVGEYVAREISGPLHAEVHIGLPRDAASRVAPACMPALAGQGRLADSGPYAARVLNSISPPLKLTDVNRPDVRGAELPSVNGIASARSLARVFGSMIGSIDGTRCLSPQAVDGARGEQWRGRDLVMGVENAMRLGFLLPSEWCPLGGPGSFGTAGFGGSRAWANPDLELAFAYTPNLCSLGHFDHRETALSRATVACARAARS